MNNVLGGAQITCPFQERMKLMEIENRILKVVMLL